MAQCAAEGSVTRFSVSRSQFLAAAVAVSLAPAGVGVGAVDAGDPSKVGVLRGHRVPAVSQWIRSFTVPAIGVIVGAMLTEALAACPGHSLFLPSIRMGAGGTGRGRTHGPFRCLAGR